MSDLKKQLIRLGSTNPELRPHIREILNYTGRGKVSNENISLIKDEFLGTSITSVKWARGISESLKDTFNHGPRAPFDFLFPKAPKFILKESEAKIQVYVNVSIAALPKEEANRDVVRRLALKSFDKMLKSKESQLRASMEKEITGYSRYMFRSRPLDGEGPPVSSIKVGKITLVGDGSKEGLNGLGRLSFAQIKVPITWKVE